MAWRQLRSIAGFDQLCSFSVGTVVQSSLIKTCDLKAWGRTILVFTGEAFLGCKSFYVLIFLSKSCLLHKIIYLKKKKIKKTSLGWQQHHSLLEVKRHVKKYFGQYFLMPASFCLLSSMLFLGLSCFPTLKVPGRLLKVKNTEHFCRTWCTSPETYQVCTGISKWINCTGREPLIRLLFFFLVFFSKY